jgi:hypothetical protein
MSPTYLLIPLFFIALILYVSWPLLSEAETLKEASPEPQREKRRKG